LFRRISDNSNVTCAALPEGGKKVSLADLIVLGVKQAPKNAGHVMTVPFATAARIPPPSKPPPPPSLCSNRSPTASALTT